MNNKVIATIEKFNMISGGEKIIVALSGGGDSVSLLHILLSLKERYSLDIEAAHVNHCIRGEDADADEAFVSALCEKLGVRLNVLRADVPAYAKENGMTVEEAGRKIRYDYFRSLAGEDGLVATAHNLNDFSFQLYQRRDSQRPVLNSRCQGWYNQTAAELLQR